MNKAKVGLLGLMLELYDRWPELKPKMAVFGMELADALSPFAEVDFSCVCNTRAQVDKTVAEFEADGVDLIIVVLLTYAPSAIALPALRQTRLPVLIWNTQQAYAVTSATTGQDTTENHGMHGVQDLANVLLRAGREFHLVTGHYQDAETLAEIKAWCDAARTARFARQMQIGLLGYPMEGMGDFGLDQTALLAQLGVTIHPLAMQAIAERARSAPEEEIAAQMARDHEDFHFEAGIKPEEHAANARLEWALRDSLQEQGLHGFASHFGAIGEEKLLDTLPFLAASRLLGEGYGFGGEGDVTSAAAVALMVELAGAANFTEMFTMDFSDNAILMMHMGEGNWTLARQDAPVYLLHSTLDLFDLRVAPLLLAFSLTPGPVTLLSLTTGPAGRLRFVIVEGDVLDFPYLPDLRRPHYKFRPRCAGGLRRFLTRFSEAGGSHHQALAYGAWAGTLEKLAALLHIDCERMD